MALYSFFKATATASASPSVLRLLQSRRFTHTSAAGSPTLQQPQFRRSTSKPDAEAIRDEPSDSEWPSKIYTMLAEFRSAFSRGDVKHASYTLEELRKNLAEIVTVKHMRDLQTQIIPFLRHFWPNLEAAVDDEVQHKGFWTYAYDHHGLYTGMAADAYFITALVKMANLTVLFSSGLQPGVYTVDDLRMKIRDITGYYPMIKGRRHTCPISVDAVCYTNPLVLEEIRVAWNENFEIIDAKRMFSSEIKCGSELIILPNIPIPLPPKKDRI